MERSKTEQYTFGVDEKETLEKISIVEASVGQNIQERNQRELIATKYYSEFVINTPKGPVTLNNVFITAEKNEQGQMSYHFRWITENGNGEQTVEENLVVDENGKAHATEGLKEYLGDEEIDIEKLMTENDIQQGRLKGISEKAEPEEIEKVMEKQDGKANQEKEKEQENAGKDEETQEIEEDLKAQGQDLELVNIRKIKDSHVAERMPEVFSDSDEHAQAYSKKLNKFVMLEKKDGPTNDENKNEKIHSSKGQWQINDKVEPAKTTLRTIISIDENGEKIERKVPYALMKTNRDDKEIAVNIGQYGEVNIETVDVLPCQERIARGVREQGEGLNREEAVQIRREFQTQGKEYPHDLAHQVENIEDAQRESNQVVDYDITPDDYIPNTETTWRELMEETGESLSQLVERFNKDMAKSEGKEESKSIVQKIVDDYQMVSHEHNRG